MTAMPFEQAARGGIDLRLVGGQHAERTKNGRAARVRVGLPGEADMDENRISVLAPVGAALIGLSTGDVFRWAGPDARARAIEVLRIED